MFEYVEAMAERNELYDEAVLMDQNAVLVANSLFADDNMED